MYKRQEIDAAQDRERRWAGRERELHSEIVQLNEMLDDQARQAHYDNEDLRCERRDALAEMTHNVDEMISQVQQRAEGMMADIDERLQHETQFYRDECAVVSGLRSDLALLAAAKTHQTSPTSTQFKSPVGTPPKSVVAPLDGHRFGVIPARPTFKQDDSVFEASSIHELLVSDVPV